MRATARQRSSAVRNHFRLSKRSVPRTFCKPGSCAAAALSRSAAPTRTSVRRSSWSSSVACRTGMRLAPGSCAASSSQTSTSWRRVPATANASARARNASRRSSASSWRPSAMQACIAVAWSQSPASPSASMASRISCASATAAPAGSGSPSSSIPSRPARASSATALIPCQRSSGDSRYMSRYASNARCRWSLRRAGAPRPVATNISLYARPSRPRASACSGSASPVCATSRSSTASAAIRRPWSSSAWACWRRTVGSSVPARTSASATASMCAKWRPERSSKRIVRAPAAG